jgi:hypothetical protein
MREGVGVSAHASNVPPYLRECGLFPNHRFCSCSCPSPFPNALSTSHPPTSGAWYGGEVEGDSDGEGGSNYGTSGRYFWFGDHDLNTVESANSGYAIDGSQFLPSLPRDSQGGLYACSTTDFVTWRNEGIMVRVRN